MLPKAEIEFHQLANIFPLMEEEELEGLVQDIRAHGLREPIVLYENKILDGRNRLRACIKAGVPCTYENYLGNDPIAYVVSLNLKRRHLDENQRAMVAAKLANMRQGARTDLAPTGAMSDASAAKLLNVGERSVERAKLVQRTAVPELVKVVERGEVSVSAAADVATLSDEVQLQLVAKGETAILAAAKEIRAFRCETKRAGRVQALVDIAKGNAKLSIAKRYPIIYADPPWRYEHPPMGGNRVIENHYPTMTLEEICALPVAELATDDAVLFMWATAPKFEECFDVIAAWGFIYKTCAVWVKDKIGMGFFVRNQHEILLIAKRGNPPMPAESDRRSSVIMAPRTEHSVKPIEFHQLIETMYPEFPRIELFARGARNGWDVWGNQSVV